MAEVFGSLTARGAEAWTRWGIRQRSFCDSWPFLCAGGNGFFISRQLLLPPERYMEPKDDRPPSTDGQIVEETVVTR